MNTLVKFFAVFALVALAACEHTRPAQQPPAAVDPGPPTQGQLNAPASQVAQQQARAAQQVTRQATAQPQAAQQAARQTTGQRQVASQEQVVITLHLAQQNQEEGLMPVDAGGSAPLYALPQPVLTQADMHRVSPVRGADEANYLLIEMNETAIPKLRLITERAKGHYLLLSVRGQLASVVQIGDPINDGRLLVGTQSPQHTQAILNLMKGQ